MYIDDDADEYQYQFLPDGKRKAGAPDVQFHSQLTVDFSGDTRLKDESPLAYKNIRSVMRGQKDLIAIRIELRPILSIKSIN